MSDDRTNTATRERDRDLARIARRCLNIETLQTRHRDDLDFHDVAVWAVRSALRAAYAAGYEQAVTDREPPPVPPEDGCPSCGERHPDRLLWREDGETIRCDSCGTTYTIPTATR